MLVPLVVLAIVMGVASPYFTRRIEPAASQLVRSGRGRTAPPVRELRRRRPSRQPARRPARDRAVSTSGRSSRRSSWPSPASSVLLAQAFTPPGRSALSSAALSLVGLVGALLSVWLLARGPGRGAITGRDAWPRTTSPSTSRPCCSRSRSSPSCCRPSYLRANEPRARRVLRARALLGGGHARARLDASSSSRCSWPWRSCRSRSTGWRAYGATHVESQESALKYFVTGAFSSAFFLYGVALLYGGEREHDPRPHLGRARRSAAGRRHRSRSSGRGCCSWASASRWRACPSTCGPPTSTRALPPPSPPSWPRG